MKKISEQLKQKFCKLYKEGKSLRYIAKEEKVSCSTVKKYLILDGVRVRCKNIVYNIKTDDDLLVGLYVGIWAGDGTQYLDRGYRIKVCCDSRNKELVGFIQKLLLKLFDKKSKTLKDRGNRVYIRFNSKFIYYFIAGFLNFGKNKTYSVHLKKPINFYSTTFLEGFVLGLMLTDGYLNKRLYFNTTSKKLAKEVYLIFEKLGSQPREYVHDRTKYGWKDLYMISLIKSESGKILDLLNSILLKMGYNKCFLSLKGYK